MNLRTLSKFFVVSMLVLSTALVFAQGGGGGRGQGGGRGGFGGQRFGMGQGPAQLAGRPDVQRDINATDQQKQQIQALNEKMREEMRAMFQGGGGGGGGFDPNAMRETFEKMNAKATEELGKILNEGQMKRLNEISVQLAGPRAILLPAVQKALGLSEDQIGKARTLQQRQQEANQSIMEKVRNQEISREEAQAAREKNDKALADEFAKLLTAEQSAKLKELSGKPFQADPPRGGS
jgi:Spy/CpxP family protein refolding chaperone